MLPGIGRRFDAHVAVLKACVLDHDDRVAALGQGIARVHGKTGSSRREQQGAAFARGKGVGRAHGVTVHGRGMRARGGTPRVHRMGEHAATGVLCRHTFLADKFFALQGGPGAGHGFRRGIVSR